jgi:hypothetical protein
LDEVATGARSMQLTEQVAAKVWTLNQGFSCLLLGWNMF